jgi:hypothetical protein
MKLSPRTPAQTPYRRGVGPPKHALQGSEQGGEGVEVVTDKLASPGTQGCSYLSVQSQDVLHSVYE